MRDLFETPELIPHDVQAILESFYDSISSYEDLERLLKLINQLGYTFDYGLDGEPFNLRKL
jgi:hypothetical protein